MKLHTIESKLGEESIQLLVATDVYIYVAPTSHYPIDVGLSRPIWENTFPGV